MTTANETSLPADEPELQTAGSVSVVRRALRRPATKAAAAFLLLLVIVAVAAPLIAPHPPNAQDLDLRFAPMSAEHWLGADEYGRDVASRLIYASRFALIAPLIAVGVACLLGITFGLWAGYRRGAVDAIANRFSDTFLAIPSIVFALAVVAVLGAGLVNAMLAIGIVLSPYLFRVVRGATMVVARETHINAARSIGAKTRRILGAHVLPNIAAPVLVQVTLLMGISLLAEASLSFLGLGVQAPDSSWGSMLKSAYENQFEAPWSVLPSGLAIVLTVLAFNTLGDGIRDAVSGRRS